MTYSMPYGISHEDFAELLCELYEDKQMSPEVYRNLLKEYGLIPIAPEYVFTDQGVNRPGYDLFDGI